MKVSKTAISDFSENNYGSWREHSSLAGYHFSLNMIIIQNGPIIYGLQNFTKNFVTKFFFDESQPSWLGNLVTSVIIFLQNVMVLLILKRTLSSPSTNKK